MNDMVRCVELRDEETSPWLQRFGDALHSHRTLIQCVQWFVVLFYLSLLLWPVLEPLPADYVHIYDNIVLFAQFIFWGIWWPFVMLSMMLVGRVWCGVFCPEGALTEWASRHGRGAAIPRWLRWGGWPFTAFVLTTVYGQLISVYEYPKAALLVLGGSTLAAMVIGFFYGKGKRVWCRHLCPASGVFGLLSRLAPLHFDVDRKRWQGASRRTAAVDCAPLINIRNMRGNSECHMCGRCSGHRNAVALSSRSMNREVLSMDAQSVSRWEVVLLVLGILGLATGAFQWTVSPWFVRLKQSLAQWLIEADVYWPLQDNAPWWLLTHYPEVNDVFSWLDGFAVVLYIGLNTLVIGGGIMGLLYLAARLLGSAEKIWQLAYGLTPAAGISIFLGLSSLTVTLLRGEYLELGWVLPLRMALLALAFCWSGYLLWQLTDRVQTISRWKKSSAWLLSLLALGVAMQSWLWVFLAL